MSNPNLARKSATSTIAGESSFNDISAAIGGGGGGGGTGKNYITTGSSFNSASTAGWSLTKATLDGTTKVPNAAPSGSATGLSIGTVGSGLQLSVSGYSLSLISTGSTLAGDMLLSDAITLDQEAQASIQTFSFFYKVASGSGNFSGTSSNTLAVAIYDATNLAWIQPAGAFNLVQSSGVGKASGTFQVPSNCTSVKLAVYFPNNTSSAITVYLDDFILGPQVIQYGAPVTDWQSYTTTVSNLGAGSSTNSARYRRVGDEIEFWVQITKDATPGSGASPVNFTLPSGVTADTAKIPSSSEGLGIANLDTATFNLQGPVFTLTTTTIAARKTGTAGNITGADLTANAVFVVRGSVPISGWSSTVQMSNDTDTRVVAARYTTAGGTAPSASDTVVKYQSLVFDTHSAYSISTGLYTVPVQGTYEIVGAFGVNSTGGWTSGNDLGVVFYKNGAQYSLKILRATANFTGAQYVEASTLIQCNAGDTIGVYSATGSTGTNSYIAVAAREWVEIKRLSGPATIAASETVAMARVISSVISVPTNVSTPLNFQYTGPTPEPVDTHNAYRLGAGYNPALGTWTTVPGYVVPVSGVYNVSATLLLSGAAANKQLFITKNAAQFASTANDNIFANFFPLTTSGIVRCNAGDILGVYYFHNTGSNVNVPATTTAAWSTFNVERIG